MKLNIKELYIGRYVIIKGERGEVTLNDGQKVIVKFLNTYGVYNPNKEIIEDLK